jgi:hypothetical protein
VPGRSRACRRRRSRLVPPTLSPTRRRRRTPQRPLRLDVQGPISSAVSAAAPIRPHGALRRRAEELRGVAKRRQASSNGWLQRPSRDLPITIRITSLQQVPTCPPANNPPPDSDCPLSAARPQHQLLLIRPARSHRRTATPLRTGPKPIGRRRPKTAGKYETSRCRCVSASSAGGGGSLGRGGSPSHIAEAHSFRASEPGARAHTRPVYRHLRRRRAIPTLDICPLALPTRACLATRFPT